MCTPNADLLGPGPNRSLLMAHKHILHLHTHNSGILWWDILNELTARGYMLYQHFDSGDIIVKDAPDHDERIGDNPWDTGPQPPEPSEQQSPPAHLPPVQRNNGDGKRK